jgi:hypothetical protein
MSFIGRPYFMKTKDEVFSRFQEFKDLVENQTGRKIKVLRSDNGGEYTSSAFKEFCVDSGIKRELTVPYNLATKWSLKEEEHIDSWDSKGKCCMIRTCPCFYGMRHATLQSIYRT